MWGLISFAVFCLQACAIEYKDHHVLAALDQLKIVATTESPSYKGVSVTFSVQYADGSPIPLEVPYIWYQDGQVAGTLANYTISGVVGSYNITVVLPALHLAASFRWVVTDADLVIHSSIKSPSSTKQNVTFYAANNDGTPFASTEEYVWSLDGVKVGGNQPNYTMTFPTVGPHNITVILTGAQSSASIAYSVVQIASAVNLSISAQLTSSGNLNISNFFTESSNDINGTITYFLNGLKVGALNFTGIYISFQRSLPLPLPNQSNPAWLSAHYEGNSKYLPATSNSLYIFANGTTIEGYSQSVTESTQSTTNTTAPGSATLSRTSIILIAIAGSVMFFICCVFCLARRSSPETLIHDSMSDDQ